MVTLNIFLEKFEFKSQAKIVESAIKIERIFKAQIPQITIDLIKMKKKVENSLSFWEFSRKKSEKDERIKKNTKNLFPFCLILEEGGAIELIARNNSDLNNFIVGVNSLLQLKKEITSLKNKIEVVCN